MRGEKNMYCAFDTASFIGTSGRIISSSFIDDIFGYVFAISCVSNMADWFDSSTTCT